MGTNLNDLIEFPQETPENEYKTWIDDFTDKLVRAKIARHLAALANHGGGHIVFGFKDNLSPDEENRPSSLDKYNRDTFTNITKRYLEPTFQCDVEFVANKNGEEFPVVRVPSHESSPIIAKANGPDQKGKTEGIVKGTYYIRKPGPESAPIETSQEWNRLIRRCLLNDRRNLLSDIGSLIHAQKNGTPTEQQRLEIWHKESKNRFLDLLSEAETSKLKFPRDFEADFIL